MSVKPDDPRMEFSRNFREMVRRDEHVASAEIDLLIYCKVTDMERKPR